MIEIKGVSKRFKNETAISYRDITSEYKYVEKFGTYDYVYTLTNGEEMSAAMKEIFSFFSTWIASWEL